MSRFACVYAAAVLAPALGFACTPALEGGRSVEGPRFRVVYRTDPARIAVGKPFAIDLVACPRDASLKVDELRVDAQMPEHRHGMNYKASVTAATTPGRYRAEGLMFHMPGKWEFLFDVRNAGGVERIRHDYLLK